MIPRLALAALIAACGGVLLLSQRTAPVAPWQTTVQVLAGPARSCHTPRDLAPYVPLPRGFDPLRAPDALLACLGFPPHKHDLAENRAIWTLAMRHARHWVPPNPEVVRLSSIHRSPALPGDGWSGPWDPRMGSETRWWAGYVAIWPSRDVWGSWQVPDELNTDLHETTDWVGMGGVRPHHTASIPALFQAGTSLRDGTCAVFHRCSAATFDFFYENLPAYEVHISEHLLPLHAHDLVYVEVWFAGGVAHYFLENLSTDTFTTQVETGSYPPPASPSAEWIQEDANVGADWHTPYSPPYNRLRIDHPGYSLPSGRDLTLATSPRLPEFMGDAGHIWMVPSVLHGNSFRVCPGTWSSVPAALPDCG